MLAFELQREYDVLGLNTIRQAQQLLVDAGLLETRQGVGAFVLRDTPQPREVDPVAELKAARAAIDRALAVLQEGEVGARRKANLTST